MNPIRQAVSDAINDAVNVSVFFRRVPDSATFPVVVYSKQSGVPLPAFDGDIQNDVWMVKAVGQNRSEVEDLSDQIKTALNRVRIPITGYDSLGLQWIGDVDYLETTDGEDYHNVGAEYRLHSEEQ